MDRSAFDGWLSDPRRPPLVMGILNLTPDSFSDGGRYADLDTAVAHALEMQRQGADLIDVGGESTRPGAQRVDGGEQIRRVVPVIQALRRRSGVVVSVDTTRAEVARAALEAGADLINDISAGREDPAMLPLVAERARPIVLMHMQGTPQTMQRAPHYDDVVAEVCAFLRQRMTAAESAGVAPQRILIDAGIGFGKTTEHNLCLLRRIGEVTGLGRPVLIGTSRKRFIGQITGEADPAQRLWGTAATVAWSIARGAAIVRVHDVAPMAQVVRMIQAIATENSQPAA